MQVPLALATDPGCYTGGILLALATRPSCYVVAVPLALATRPSCYSYAALGKFLLHLPHIIHATPKKPLSYLQRVFHAALWVFLVLGDGTRLVGLEVLI